MNTGLRDTVLGKPFQEYFFTTPPPFPHFHQLLYMVKVEMEGGTDLSNWEGRGGKPIVWWV